MEEVTQYTALVFVCIGILIVLSDKGEFAGLCALSIGTFLWGINMYGDLKHGNGSASKQR